MGVEVFGSFGSATGLTTFFGLERQQSVLKKEGSSGVG